VNSEPGSRLLLVLDQAFEFDLNAFAGCAAMTGPCGQQRAGFLGRGRLDAPFLEPSDQHPRVKKPRRGLPLSATGFRGGRRLYR
jgi:hypothetical protein